MDIDSDLGIFASYDAQREFDFLNVAY